MTWKRNLYGINALVPIFGLSLSMVLTILGTYPSTPEPNILGNNPAGLAGVFGRFFDFFTYFTNVSNIVVIIVMVALWRNPSRNTRLFQILRMDSMLMIIVTGMIFIALLAPKAQLQGLEYVTNTCQHYITPALTVVVWLVAGPRRQLFIRNIIPSMAIPIIYVIITLIRGAVINAYPYPFFNVAAHGYANVLTTVLELVVVAVILALILIGIDKLLVRNK